MIKRAMCAFVTAAFTVLGATELTLAAKPPSAFLTFCANNPSQCRATSSSRGPVQLNADRWSQIKTINASVNKSIREVSDPASGSSDRWSIVALGGMGDCEDFVLTKRSRLLKAGFPASALLVTVVRTRSGQGHAVLTVRTSKGDYILDNLTSSIRTANRTGYRFYTRQSESDPRSWISLRHSKGAHRRPRDIVTSKRKITSFGYSINQASKARSAAPRIGVSQR